MRCGAGDGVFEPPGEQVSSGAMRRQRRAGWRLRAPLEAAEQRELLGCAMQRRLAAAACQRQQPGRWRAAAATYLVEACDWVTSKDAA